MARIALLGAGQLGSRHLQGLALLDRDASITVVDPSRQALRTACERFEQVKSELANPRVRMVSYLESLDDLEGEFDLVIVATNADHRREVIERAVARVGIGSMILEKVLFQSVADYPAVGHLLEARGIKAWVNCTQRLWPFFSDLKPRLLGKRHVHILVTGSRWGLGCNAIHNLDLIPFYSGDSSVNFLPRLDPGTAESKRPGFIEFTGTLTCTASGQITVSQTSWHQGDAAFTFEVIADDLRHIWRVTEGVVYVADAHDGWAWRTREMRPPYQSQLTNIVAQQILDSGDCALPDYTESAGLHVKLLEVFLNHLAESQGTVTDRCPIT